MPSDALAIAPAILSVVLIVSAVGKLRSTAASAEAFTALQVPKRLATPAVVKALPWVEIVLGLSLVSIGGWVGVVVALAVLALFAAYLVLVIRARGFETDVDCACFGSLGPGRITRLTVWRNAWLLVLALVSLAVAASGDALLRRIAEGTAPWEWLLAAAATAVTVLLVVGPGSETSDVATAETSGDLAVEEGDYLRVRTPAVVVSVADGSTTHLRQLSAQRPQLLVYVSEGCFSCQEVIASIPTWREQLPAVDVRVVVRQSVDATALTSREEPMSLHDTEGLVSESLDMRATPSAVLLGADGLLAGGPVAGATAVPEFVSDIRAELAAGQLP